MAMIQHCDGTVYSSYQGTGMVAVEVDVEVCCCCCWGKQYFGKKYSILEIAKKVKLIISLLFNTFYMFAKAPICYFANLTFAPVRRLV